MEPWNFQVLRKWYSVRRTFVKVKCISENVVSHAEEGVQNFETVMINKLVEAGLDMEKDLITITNILSKRDYQDCKRLHESELLATTVLFTKSNPFVFGGGGRSYLCMLLSFLIGKN